MLALPASRRGHFDIFWLSWRGPCGPHGRDLCRAAISDPSIKCCFSCSEERGLKGRERECAQESLGWDTQKDLRSNISDNNCCDQYSYSNDFVRTDCNVVIISHGACTVKNEAKYTAGYQFSFWKPASLQLPTPPPHSTQVLSCKDQ